MEEEVNYVTVTFKTNGVSKQEKPNELDIIYDEVKTCQEQELDTTPAIPDKTNELDLIYDEVKTHQEQELDTTPAIPAGEKRAPLCSLLRLMAAGLGISCLALLSVVIVLTMNFNTVLSENLNLTAEKLQLWTEMTELQRRTAALSRQRDALSWTVGTIMEYEYFPVKLHCPHKECKPCMDGWLPFQSNCYFFSTSNSYYDWKNWADSRKICKVFGGDLVVIDSQEEQEFINNNTIDYNDEKHGYWIGLSNKDATWAWVDGSNFTVMYWKPREVGYSTSCAVSHRREEPLANWLKVSCDMWSRWICETRALIKPESDPNS